MKEVMRLDKVPPTLSSLSFSCTFQSPLPYLSLPSSLIHLSFDRDFNHPVDLSYLSRLSHLSFDLSYHFNHTLENKLPPSLTHLSLSNDYNFPIIDLPPKLIYLNFGEAYSHSLPLLPSSITHLILGYRFNKPISNVVFPSSITHLKFSGYFNQSLDSLPNTIIYLHVVVTSIIQLIIFLPPLLVLRLMLIVYWV